MNTKIQVTRTVAIFIGLAVAGIGIALSARFVTEPIEQTLTVTVGSAIFGAALTFFLIRLLTLIEK